MKFAFKAAALLIFIAAVIVFLNYGDLKNYITGETNETRLFSGPIPQGMNESHFRHTGELIELEPSELLGFQKPSQLKVQKKLSIIPPRKRASVKALSVDSLPWHAMVGE